MVSSARGVIFGGLKRRVASFRVAGMALRDIQTCVVTCGKSFFFAWQVQYFCDVFRCVAVFWQAQHFGRVHLHSAWQAQHFRRVVLRVFCDSQFQGYVKWRQSANSVAGVAFCEMWWNLTEASQTSILKLQSMKIGGSLARNARFDAPTCLVSSRMALCDTPLITCLESFCVAHAILLRRFHKMSCSFRGRRSTLVTSSVILRGRRSTSNVSHCVQTPRSTLHTPHSTLYTSHSTLYIPHFTLYTLHSTLYTPHSTLHTLHFTLHTSHSTLYTLHSNTVHFTLYTKHYTLYTPHSTLYTPNSTLYTPHFTLYTLHSTLYTPHFTLYTPHSTLYTPHSTLYTPHVTLHTLHFTLCTLHFTLYTPGFAVDTLHSTLYDSHFRLYA